MSEKEITECPSCGSEDLYFELEPIFARIPDEDGEPMEYMDGEGPETAMYLKGDGLTKCGHCSEVFYLSDF